MFSNPEKSSDFRFGLLDYRQTLRFRLSLIIIGASLLSTFVFAGLYLRDHRQHLIEAAQTANTALGNAIKANLRHAMITNDWELMEESVQAIVAEGALNSLRILDDQGSVRVSSITGETGIKYMRADRVCQACHVDNLSPRRNNILFTPDGGREVMVNVNVIRNQQECQACHPPGDEILGLLMIETSMTTVNAQLRTAFWRIMLIAFTSLLLLIGLISQGLNALVVRPIKELARGVAEIGLGNLSYQVPIKSEDELGKLAGSFEEMRQQLNITRAAMLQREHELATLNEVGLAATQLLDLKAILDLTVETMADRLGMEEVMVYLQDEDTGRFTLRASFGITRQQLDEIERRRKGGHDITQDVVETGKELFVANMADDARFHGVWEHLQDRSYVKLPLMSRGTVVGVLGVVTPVGGKLTLHDVEVLKAVGREIGIAIDNAQLLAETKERENQAMALYQLGVAISASLALDEVLPVVAKAAQELIGADIGLVGLIDEAHKEVIVSAVVGATTNKILNRRIRINDQPPWGELLAGLPYFTNGDDPAILNLHDEDLILQEQIQSLLAAPLMRGGQFLGLIEVSTRNPRIFQERDGMMLLRLANQVVVAIENAHLYHQLRHLVALEERDRLAREMHDHLAQGLAYLKVKAAITEELFSGGNVEEGQESMQELKKASQILYTDVREEIFNLRTAVTERVDFFATLQEYLSNYQTHYGLDVDTRIETECPSEFAPEVASQLLRIIQEALTNVRRHSDAGKVFIHCLQGGEQVMIRIEDDGRGFFPAEVDREAGQRYGLQIMRERAESVGGSLDLESEPGKGTRVIVRVPALVTGG